MNEEINTQLDVFVPSTMGSVTWFAFRKLSLVRLFNKQSNRFFRQQIT